MIEAMSFNPDIYKHPPVQYIPLYLYNIEFDSNWRNNGQDRRPYVQVWQTEAEMRQGLSRLGVPFPPTAVDFSSRTTVLVLNGQVQDVKYRAYTVYLVGKEIPGAYHLFSLTRRYYYKDRLHFIFFNHRGDRLAWDNIVLSHKP
ncbi:MAG: hypothetical protein ACOX3A_06065 [bacterium]